MSGKYHGGYNAYAKRVSRSKSKYSRSKYSKSKTRRIKRGRGLKTRKQ